MDRNYLILFEDYNKVGEILNQVKEELKEAYLNETTELRLLQLSDSLNKLLTEQGDTLREYSQLQQTGKMPTNCPK